MSVGAVHGPVLVPDTTISVIVPVFHGVSWIKGCLESLANQTLSRELFEIVLVFNGPKDGGLDLAASFFESESTLRHTILDSGARGAAAARNEGTRRATSTHVTWLDVDDRISPEYLELMALAASPGLVPYAQIHNVSADGLVSAYNTINDDFFRQKKANVSVTEFPRALTFMTAKLIPKGWAIECPLNEDLQSGEDVAFYGDLMAKFDFKLSLMPAAAGATYYRQLVEQSVSRGRSDYDFLVVQRAHVIRSLSDALRDCQTAASPVIRSFMSSQASFIKRYLTNNPHEREKTLDFLTCLQIPHFPWSVVRQSVDQLVVAYNFAPYSDTGAVVASKRIREAGAAVDVISNSMATVRESLAENSLLANAYVARLAELSAPTTFASSRGIEDFVIRGLAQHKTWVVGGRKYGKLYSRSMWPASHFLAAKLRMNNPSLIWRAEFSDPVRLNNEGVFRESKIQSSDFMESYFEGLPDVAKDVLYSNVDVYAWTENLPYLFADEIVFTNEHQKTVMLSYAPDVLRDSIGAKSTVSAHPTLPRLYYELGTPNNIREPERVNIGYFGEFYSTRGLHEVSRAIDALSDRERSRLLIHVFTASKEATSGSFASNGDVVKIHSKLSYLDFLGVLDQFDCLIVNDSSTADHHKMNPYLPSKYSDYSGSRAHIWSIVERGSVLSQKQTRFTSEIGDVEQAGMVLRQLLETSDSLQ